MGIAGTRKERERLAQRWLERGWQSNLRPTNRVLSAETPPPVVEAEPNGEPQSGWLLQMVKQGQVPAEGQEPRSLLDVGADQDG
jgi:hypothetical protein